MARLRARGWWKLREPKILSWVEHRALHEINVQVTVVVVIEQSHAGSHDFRHGVLADSAVEMMKLQADFFGSLKEQRNLLGTSADRTPRRAHTSSKPQGEQLQKIATTVNVSLLFCEAFGGGPLPFFHGGIPGGVSSMRRSRSMLSIRPDCPRATAPSRAWRRWRKAFCRSPERANAAPRA